MIFIPARTANLKSGISSPIFIPAYFVFQAQFPKSNFLEVYPRETKDLKSSYGILINYKDIALIRHKVSEGKCVSVVYSYHSYSHI